MRFASYCEPLRYDVVRIRLLPGGGMEWSGVRRARDWWATEAIRDLYPEGAT